MKTCIGTKIVRLLPMTRGEYNDYRGWAYPEGEDQSVQGYLVEYTDGGKPNDIRHAGYISWSPKEQADAAYRPIDGMSFGLAIEALKKGARVARAGWNGKGMFLFLVAGSRFTVNRPPLLGIYPEGTVIDYHAHIDMKTAQGYVEPWLASQADMLADDWQIVEADATAPSADDRAAQDDMLLRQSQLWLEAVVPLSPVDPEQTTIDVVAKSGDGSRTVASVKLADTMTALQLRNGKALTAAAKALVAEAADDA